MRLVLHPVNPGVGDHEGNARLVEGAARAASEAGADLLLLPELALTAYPPRDLLLRPHYLAAVEGTARRLAERLPAGLTVVVGAPWRPADGDGRRALPGETDPGARTTNSLLVMRGGAIVDRYDKRLLPDYDIFDEPRYFKAGDRAVVIGVPTASGVTRRVGLAICEDIWRAADVLERPDAEHRYGGAADPLGDLVGSGAELICLANASPFVRHKAAQQARILGAAAERAGVPVAGVNLAGANDDLIFDGHAAVYAPSGDGGARCVAASPLFTEAGVTLDLPNGAGSLATAHDPAGDDDADRLTALAIATGIRDYCRKTRHPRVTLGLSGGIDSALVATLAAMALGPGSVLGVRLPSRYSSDHSLEDAEALARNLGIELADYAIGRAHEAVESSLGELWRALALENAQETGLTEENLQSRIRGLAMMAVSNKTGRLLLTTGNKSEHATGYATLYGDQNGGLAPIADLLKTECYDLARFLNAHHGAFGLPVPPIPERTITKPPSAELRPGQTDQDTLPPYETLDRVIELSVDHHLGPEEIVERTGFDGDMVWDITRRIDLNEHKRFQLCVALKLRPRAFGPGRRAPVVNAPEASAWG